jgi:hypothetical protein
MLIAPIDAINSTGWDPINWDKKLKELRTYIWDLWEPLQDEIDRFEEYERQMEEERACRS